MLRIDICTMCDCNASGHIHKLKRLCMTDFFVDKKLIKTTHLKTVRSSHILIENNIKVKC